MLETLLFYIFAGLTLVGALLTITRRSAVLSAVWLTVSLLGVAGIFLLLGAEFLFVAQIVLYTGGITLLFLFVIMLVNLDAAAKVRQFRRAWPLIILAGGGFDRAAGKERHNLAEGRRVRGGQYGSSGGSAFVALLCRVRSNLGVAAGGHRRLGFHGARSQEDGTAGGAIVR